MAETKFTPEKCGHGVPMFGRHHCTQCDVVWLQDCLERFEKQALKLKREAFDLGFHEAHIRLSNAEHEARAALASVKETP